MIPFRNPDGSPSSLMTPTGVGVKNTLDLTATVKSQQRSQDPQLHSPQKHQPVSGQELLHRRDIGGQAGKFIWFTLIKKAPFNKKRCLAAVIAAGILYGLTWLDAVYGHR